MGCVFQDLEPPKSSSISRKSTKVSRLIRCVQFSKAALRHADIRESKDLPLGVICPADPHERSPYPPNFEDRSQEETERQERCARGDAVRLAKSTLSSKKRTKLLFYHLLRFGVSLHHPQQNQIIRCKLSRIGNRKSL